MPFFGGAAGGGKAGMGSAIKLTEIDLPNGLHYWVNPNDPGYGYLKNDRSSPRYPISYIVGLAADTTPKGSVTRRVIQPADVPTAALGGTIKVIYGTDRVGGDIFFGPFVTGGNQLVTFGIGFGEGPCDSIALIESDFSAYPSIATPGATFNWFSGFGSFAFYKGEDAPAAADVDIAAAAGEPTTNFERYPGLCWAKMQLTFNAGSTPRIPNLKWTIKGRRLYDPRKDSTNGGAGTHRFNDSTTWEWSDNAELCYTDYLTNTYYGKGVPFTLVNWPIVRANADYCDTILGDGRKRFTFSTTIGTTATHDQNLDFIRSHFRASRWFMSNGLYTHFIDQPGASVATLDEGVNCTVGTRSRVKTADIPRLVTYNWTDPSRDYQKATAMEPQTPPTGDPRKADYNGDGCRNPGQAQSQATYLFKDRSLDFRASVIYTEPDGLKFQIGDIVTLNLPSFGLSGYLARFIRIEKSPDGRYFCDFKPYDASVYVDTIKTIETKPAMTLPSPDAAPPAPSGLTLTEEKYIDQMGFTQSRVAIAWTAQSSYPYYDKTRVKVQRVGFPQFLLGEFESGPVYIPATLDVSILYTVTLTTLSLQGNESTAAVATIATVGKTTPPSNVGAIVVAQREADVYCAWPAVSDGDVRTYELRRGPVGATWETMNFVSQVNGIEYFDTPPTGIWVYAVKAIDFAGNRSVTAATAQLQVFYYGPDSAAGDGLFDGTPLAQSVIAGDVTYVNAAILTIIEGYTIQQTMTYMMARAAGNNSGASPAEADAEIATAGYTSIQQWEDNKDAPRRNGAGIWAPLWTSGHANTVQMLNPTPHVVNGDGLGWRNYALKADVPNATLVGVSTANARAQTYITFTGIGADTSNYAVQPSPINVGQNGGQIKLGIVFSTDNPCAQVILRPPFSGVFRWQKSLTYPKVMSPTDYVTDVSGLVTFSYPNLLLAPTGIDQVPHLSIEPISATVPVAWTITSMNRGGATVTAYNASTGAVLVGQTLRISAEDRGGGGSVSIS